MNPEVQNIRVTVIDTFEADCDYDQSQVVLMQAGGLLQAQPLPREMLEAAMSAEPQEVDKVRVEFLIVEPEYSGPIENEDSLLEALRSLGRLGSMYDLLILASKFPWVPCRLSSTGWPKMLVAPAEKVGDVYPALGWWKDDESSPPVHGLDQACSNIGEADDDGKDYVTYLVVRRKE